MRTMTMDDVCYMMVSVYRHVVIQLGQRNKQVIQLEDILVYKNALPVDMQVSSSSAVRT